MDERSNIIFLDIDGVLNSAASIGQPCPVEETLLMILSAILKETGARIVLSSTWRLSPPSVRILKNSFRNAGIDPSVLIGATAKLEIQDMLDPNSGYVDYSLMQARGRVMEIHEYLEKHKDSIWSWVVIDDMDLSVDGHLGDRFVKTERLVGLTKKIASQVVEKLNSTCWH